MEVKKKVKPALEAIECLRDPSLEEREQKIIRNEFEVKSKRILAELVGEGLGTVRGLLEEELVE